MSDNLPTCCREAAERLRPYWGEVGIEPVRCLRESADEIERLRKELASDRRLARAMEKVERHSMTVWPCRAGYIAYGTRAPDKPVYYPTPTEAIEAAWVGTHGTTAAAEAAGGDA